MSVDVTVFYGAGDILAPDVINPLSSVDAAAKSLGESILADAFGLQEISLTCVANMDYIPGAIVQVVDGRQGKIWYGKIINVAHTLNTSSSISFESKLEILKVL